MVLYPEARTPEPPLHLCQNAQADGREVVDGKAHILGMVLLLWASGLLLRVKLWGLWADWLQRFLRLDRWVFYTDLMLAELPASETDMSAWDLGMFWAPAVLGFHVWGLLSGI